MANQPGGRENRTVGRQQLNNTGARSDARETSIMCYPDDSASSSEFC